MATIESFDFEKVFTSIIGKQLNMKFGQHCLKVFLKNFTQESYLKNGSLLKWKPLTDKYSAYKKTKNNYPIGVFTTKLKTSFSIDYNTNGFEIKNDCEYAQFFDEERPILYQDNTIDKVMLDFIDVELKKITLQYLTVLKNDGTPDKRYK